MDSLKTHDDAAAATSGVSPPGNVARAANCDIVVVDNGGVLADRLSHALQKRGIAGDVRRVEDYLLALGDVATHGPPRAMVGRLDTLDDHAWDRGRTLAAVRRLMPTGKMFAVLSDGEQLPPDLNGLYGFDRVINEPIDGAALDNMVDSMASVADRGGDKKAEQSEAPDSSAPSGESQRKSPSSAMLVGSACGPAHAARVDREAADGRSVAAQLHEADAIMIDALLDVRTSMRDKAMSAVCDVLDDHAAVLVDSGDAATENQATAGAQIDHDGQQFGSLVTCIDVDAGARDACAAWLGRWLALEKRMGQLWEMALRDDLTGAWNRRYLYRFLHNVLGRAARERFHVTLLLFDIDNFKSYNDRFGHAAGDDILRETVHLLKSLIRKDDIVARVGGDEFAVVFWDAEQPRQANSRHPNDVLAMAQRFQRAINEHQFPKLLDEARGALTISGGLASYPWDGSSPDVLVRVADEALIQSKRQGKNAITLGPGVDRLCNGG